ncbi:MAG: ABC transporter substrate-binding protein [Desulfobacteraceae bacterium]|nr:ABC transporter substrate-binding protein [Desulfobacteraceae bacterium]
MKSVCAIGFLLLLVSLLAGPAVASSESPKNGGIFKMATHQDIPTLDCMMTSADVVYDVGGHIFETLVQYITADGKIAPELADSWTVSKDSLKFTFKIRQGVKFHNGAELTSEDVLASVDRWFKHGARGGIARPYLDRLSTPDKYTFEIHLNQPYAPLFSLLGFGMVGR